MDGCMIDSLQVGKGVLSVTVWMYNNESSDPRCCTEVLPDRLYFCVLSRLPTDTSTAHYFTIDETLRYEPFFTDFGPLNINNSYKFCQILRGKLSDPQHSNKRIYFYCANRPQNKSNAAVLVGIYLVVYGGKTSAEAYEPLKQLEPYLPFRDASQGLCTFRLLPQHVLRAVAKAFRFGWFDWNNWNSAEYEHFESVENGDLNIVVPGKFVAFAGPHATSASPEYPGCQLLTPADYLPIFKMYGVTTVIRLNKKCYEKREFTQAGIAHHDLFFADGTVPSNAILDKFLQICEQATGAIAVHCKAGLGRTGTTIGCYLMKHYHMSAAEAIAWLRLARPGSVIACQQHYLKLQEPRMWKLGKMIGANGSSTNSAAGSSSNSASHSPVRAQSAQGLNPATAAGAATTNGTTAAQQTTASTSSSLPDAHAALLQPTSPHPQSSTSIHHPAPTPSYALSQPSSPVSPTDVNGQSYSASFDTPPTMHQQKIQSGHQFIYSSNTSSPLRMTNGGPLNALVTRGRAKQTKPIVTNGHTSNGYDEDSKDADTSQSNHMNGHTNGYLSPSPASSSVITPGSAPQAQRNGSTGKWMVTKPEHKPNGFITSPSALTGPYSVAISLGLYSPNGTTTQRRAPSAHSTVARRSTSPGSAYGSPLATNFNLTNTLAAAALYGLSPTASPVILKKSTSPHGNSPSSPSASSSSSSSSSSPVYHRPTLSGVSPLGVRHQTLNKYTAAGTRMKA